MIVLKGVQEVKTENDDWK